MSVEIGGAHALYVTIFRETYLTSSSISCRSTTALLYSIYAGLIASRREFLTTKEAALGQRKILSAQVRQT